MKQHKRIHESRTYITCPVCLEKYWASSKGFAEMKEVIEQNGECANCEKSRARRMEDHDLSVANENNL